MIFYYDHIVVGTYYNKWTKWKLENQSFNINMCRCSIVSTIVFVLYIWFFCQFVVLCSFFGHDYKYFTRVKKSYLFDICMSRLQYFFCSQFIIITSYSSERLSCHLIHSFWSYCRYNNNECKTTTPRVMVSKNNIKSLHFLLPYRLSYLKNETNQELMGLNFFNNKNIN